MDVKYLKVIVLFNMVSRTIQVKSQINIVGIRWQMHLICPTIL